MFGIVIGLVAVMLSVLGWAMIYIAGENEFGTDEFGFPISERERAIIARVAFVISGGGLAIGFYAGSLL